MKSSTYIDFDWENDKEDPKFEVGNHVRISRYQNIFANAYVPNWSEDVFVNKKVKNTVPWMYVLEEIVGTFYESKLQKTDQKDIRIEKLSKRKDEKLYLKWKGYDNCFNSRIEKKIFLYNLSYFLEPYVYPYYKQSKSWIRFT